MTIHCHTISQYTSGPGNRAHYYAELIVSSPAVAKIVANTCTYSPKDGQAEWAWINTVRGHQTSTIWAQRKLTLLMRPSPSPIRQTSKQTVRDKGGIQLINEVNSNALDMYYHVNLTHDKL